MSCFVISILNAYTSMFAVSVIVCVCVVLHPQYFPVITEFLEGDYQKNAVSRQGKKSVLCVVKHSRPHPQSATNTHTES